MRRCSRALAVTMAAACAATVGAEGLPLPWVCAGAAFAASDQPVQRPRAKRVAPPDVPAVMVGGVRIEALHWGRSRDLKQNGGYIAAVDPKSGRELWTLKVYDVAYDGKMEEDVQDVFIRKMTKMSPSRLLIVDEKGRRYSVEVNARTVTRL